MLDVPFAGHAGWGVQVFDRGMDVFDFVRELAAMVFNARLLLMP